MSKQRHHQDLFDPSLREEVLKSQKEYIDGFKETYLRLLCLQGHDEANALGDLHNIIDLQRRLLAVPEIMEMFNLYSDISNYLMDHFFKELATLILKVAIFPNVDVMENTALFLELYMCLCLRVVKKGFYVFMRMPDQILASGKRQFYTNNNAAKAEPHYYPFGHKMEDLSEYSAWSEQLKVGDLVDAVKHCPKETKAIWSRAQVVEIDSYNVTVRFVSELQKIYARKVLTLTPYSIRPLGEKSLDYEWRQNLKPGALVDINYGRKGWILFKMYEVEETVHTETGETVIRGSFKPEESFDDYSSEEDADCLGRSASHLDIQVNVHDPFLRRPHTFSTKRFVSSEYCSDEVYEAGNEDKFAIFRGRFEVLNARKELYINSRYFLRTVNIYCMEGGLNLFIDKIKSGEQLPTDFVGSYMCIIESISPYLLNRTVELFGAAIVENATKYILACTPDSLKTLSSETLKSVYSGIYALARRVYPLARADEITETFYLQMALMCIKTDYLERKLNGVTFLSEISKNIKYKDFSHLKKSDLTELIESENIVEQILKGHPQLIAKSADILKLVFEEDKMTDKNMLLIWTILRKGDLETRNSLLNLLNTNFYELKYRNMEFLINQIKDVEPKLLMPDEIELVFKMVNFSKYKVESAPATESHEALNEKVIKVFWKIATSDDITNYNLIKKSIDRLASLLKFSEKKPLQLAVINDAIENLKKGHAIIQSLKVIRKFFGLYDTVDSELMDYVLESGIISQIFSSLKKLKSDIKAAAAKAGITLTETSINTLSTDKVYNFETQITKRLEFIEKVILSHTQSKEVMLGTFNAIWEEIVENSLLEVESSYFKKWFMGIVKEETQKGLSRDILLEFFNSKIQILMNPPAAFNKKDILTIFSGLFVKLNLLSGKLTSVVVKLEEEHSYTTDTRLLVTVNPEELDGMSSLWDVALQSKDDIIVNDVILLISNQYVRPELEKVPRDDNYGEYMKVFLNKVTKLFLDIHASGQIGTDPDATKRAELLLRMITDVIDKTESKQFVKNVSLSSFYRGKTATMNVDNKISVSYNTPKSIEIKVAGNTTVHQIKHMISKEIKRTTWKNIKLSRGLKKIEIPEKFNSRTLRDAGISLGDKLTSEHRPTPTMKAEPLILMAWDNSPYINPKALKAFKQIFHSFAVEGLMRPEQCAKYVEGALDEKNIPADYQQIKDLLAKYDKTNKGALDESEFLEFYTDSCHSKAMAVMGNLKNLGYNDQLELNEEQAVEFTEELARDYILQKADFTNLLYDMIESQPQLASTCMSFLSRLKPLPHVLNSILTLEGLENANSPGWKKLLDPSATFKSLYNMYIIDFLLDDAKVEDHENPLEDTIQTNLADFKKDWTQKFIKIGGYQFLHGLLKSYVAKGIETQNEVLLFSFIMKAVKTYLLACTTNEQPEIYSNIAFISSSNIPFGVLAGLEPKKAVAVDEKTFQQAIEKEESANSGTVFIGPMLPGAARNVAIDSTTTATTTQTAETKQQEQHKEALTEKPEFIEFRQSLAQTHDDGLKTINPEETIRFLVRLCESVLTKTDNFHFEELTIIELSLSIIFCLVLLDKSLLKRLVINDEIKLLQPNSSLAQEGHSDFINFFIAGLLTKRGFFFVKFFDNAFKILLREAGTAETQIILVRVIFQNALKEGQPLRNLSRHIELAALLLESICSDKVDNKIHLKKEDINSVINLNELFYKVFESLFKIKAAPKEEVYFETELIINYFRMLEKILAIEPSLKGRLLSESSNSLIGRVFNQCLFIRPDADFDEDSSKELVCRNTFTRSAAFDFLLEACKDNSANMKELNSVGLQLLSQHLPKVNTWAYVSTNGRRSELGFSGLYNLCAICYMNAMLQQFYLTPTFRYGVLMANDYKDEVIVEDKDHRIDDNLFHQLQKMFAFLDRSERRDYNPYDFCFSFKDFSGNPTNVNIQQDTKEFLDVFFDKIETALKPTPFKNILNDVYGGKQINLMECGGCGNLRTREEVFYNLSLEVKNLNNINEGIERLITEDIISDYKCENCQQKCDLIKKTFLKECPNVLIVHLQRIIFDVMVLENLKINSWYEFPQKLDLKNYTYSNYQQQQAAADKDKEGESTKNAKGADDDKPQPEASETADAGVEGTAETPAAPAADDQDYEYTLVGVIVHMGTAAFGHYYSYINVNRNDPKRPKIVEDKWVEFNDSTIKHFKLSDLEEECFGSKEEKAVKFDDDFEGFLGAATGFKGGMDKCAYILVYDKVKKSPVTFEFNQTNIAEKDLILSNLQEGKASQAVFEEHDDGTSTLKVGFYDLKPYAPPKLEKLVRDDNFQLLIEQHVFSKDFLNFISKVSDIPGVPEFNPFDLPDRIYQHPVDPHTKDTLVALLNTNLNFLFEVFSKADDSVSVVRFSLNICRAISICHEVAPYLLEHKIQPQMNHVLAILTESTEANVRKAVSDILVHLILVAKNTLGIKLSPQSPFAPVQDPEPHPIEKLIKTLLFRLMLIMRVDKKDLKYKKLKGYFKIWSTLAKQSKDIIYFLIKSYELPKRIINYYMDKKPSAYDSKYGLSEHEQAVEPLLRALVHITNFIKTYNEQAAPEDAISWDAVRGLQSSEIYEKLMVENFNFNNYQTAKELVRHYCKGDFVLSKQIILVALKNMTVHSDNLQGFLECFKELLTIQDDFAIHRREMILGFPTIMDTKDYHKKIRYGLSGNKNLTSPILKYKSPLSLNNSNMCLLKLLIDARDKNELNCLIMVCYLVDMMNCIPDVLDYVVKLPSPLPCLANYHDWLASYYKYYVTNKESSHFITSMDSVKSLFFEVAAKELLATLEDKYLAYLAANYPEADPQHYTLFVDSVKDFKIGDSYYSTSFTQAETAGPGPHKPIFALSSPLLVGRGFPEELEIPHTIYENDTDKLVLRVTQIPVFATESVPVGWTNLKLCSAFMGGTITSTTNTALAKFLDMEDPFAKEAQSAAKEQEYPARTGTNSEDFVVVLNEHGAKAAQSSADPSDTTAASPATSEPVAPQEPDLNYFYTNYMAKISLSNQTSSSVVFTFRLTPGEDANFYSPLNDFSTVVSSKKSMPVLILVKKDPKKPFGRFTLEVLFQETDDADPSTFNLEFDEESRPFVYEFALPLSAEDEFVEAPPADAQAESDEESPEYD